MHVRSFFLGWALLLPVTVVAQQPLVRSGQVTAGGRALPYLVRHLPVNAFPELPERVRAELERRSCLIPQTYQAHRPENVLHASLERAGSEDWAALCAVEGRVSLLVFFSDRVAPEELAVAEETDRLQLQASTGVMGFSWGIDPASPEQVHEAQAGLQPRPARLTHDALADAVIDRRTVFHYFSGSRWTEAPLPE